MLKVWEDSSSLPPFQNTNNHTFNLDQGLGDKVFHIQPRQLRRMVAHWIGFCTAVNEWTWILHWAPKTFWIIKRINKEPFVNEEHE